MVLLRCSWGLFGACLLVCSIGLGYLRNGPSQAMLIAYAADKNGPTQIYTMDFYGQQSHVLTDGVGDDLGPVWSPANNYVAFSSFRGQASGIYLVPPRGGMMIELPLATGSAINPQWSPRGDYLVFERFTTRGDRSLMGYDVAANDLKVLTTPRQSDWFPVWGTDGDHVLYLSSGGGTDQLMTMNVQNRTTQALTSADRTYGHPTWSPDGRFVAYESDGGDIWRLDLLDGSERQLTDTPQHDSMPAWSPDGAWIAFMRDDEDRARQVYRMNREGGAVLRLSDPEAMHQAVGAMRWSDEGAWLAYVGIAPRVGTTAIYRVGANGQQHARLTPHTHNSSSPAWSPRLDGRLRWAWLAVAGLLAGFVGAGMAGLRHHF